MYTQAAEQANLSELETQPGFHSTFCQKETFTDIQIKEKDLGGRYSGKQGKVS